MTLSYHSYLDRIIQLYGEGNFKGALEYLNENRYEVNGIDSQIDNFAFCIAALDGDAKLAMDIFEKAIREKGFWFETSQLESDSDLDIIRNDVKFKALLEMNRRREHECLGLGQAMVHVRDGKHDKGYIILHGNHENARITKGAWSEEAVDGAFSAFLQSGQPDFHDAYHWNDREKAIADTVELIEKLKEDHPDIQSWTLVGFSMSATVALDVVSRKLFKPDHLILFGPWIPYVKDERDKLSVLNQITKISVLIGDKDEDCAEHADMLVKMLADHAVQADFIKMKNTGHGFPEDLKMYLDMI